MKNFILANGQKFFIHPLYKKYAANEEGEIIHVKLGKPRKGNLVHGGYFQISIYIQENKIKKYSSHRFVYECFYGLIEKNKQINHINSVRVDNRIKNLEVVSASENCKKSRSQQRDWFLSQKSKKGNSRKFDNKKRNKF